MCTDSREHHLHIIPQSTNICGAPLHVRKCAEFFTMMNIQAMISKPCHDHQGSSSYKKNADNVNHWNSTIQTYEGRGGRPGKFVGFENSCRGRQYSLENCLGKGCEQKLEETVPRDNLWLLYKPLLSPWPCTNVHICVCVSFLKKAIWEAERQNDEIEEQSKSRQRKCFQLLGHSTSTSSGQDVIGVKLELTFQFMSPIWKTETQGPGPVSQCLH